MEMSWDENVMGWKCHGMEMSWNLFFGISI